MATYIQYVIVISWYECDIIVITRVQVRGAAEESVNNYDITRHNII